MGRKKIPNLTIKIHEGIDFNEVSQNEHVKEIVYCI
jgi:hypothetical protein